MWIFIVLAVVALILLWAAATYNSLISLRNKSEESFSTMDVYLKKRYDLIPNFVETVKGYVKHESETLEKVVAARYAAMNATSSSDKIENENILQGTLKSLFALTENYPDLKANTNFLALQAQLQSIEDEIANSRKYYNAVIKQYNTTVETVPTNIIASIFNFIRKPFFEVSDIMQRENVRVDFN